MDERGLCAVCRAAGLTGPTPEEQRLGDLMSDIGEAALYAGWEASTEFEVWRLATEGGSWARASATELGKELAEILDLATRLNRWIVWHGGEGPDYEAVDLPEWRRRYAAWAHERNGS